MHSTDCLLCHTPGGTVLWQNEQLRVIDACDALYPGFTRVIWTAHVVEMTDLSVIEQSELLRIVMLVEKVQRAELKPDKVNLAAFGNVVPHLHWHVIPRFENDQHFPNSHWGEAMRDIHTTLLDENSKKTLKEKLATLVACALTAS